MASDKSIARHVEQARRVGGYTTKKEALRSALMEYIARHHQTNILKHFGTFDFDPAYDYKSERNRKRVKQDTD